VVKVNPALYIATCSSCVISRRCPFCTHLRVPVCGLVIDRDHNSSVNILMKRYKPVDEQAESFQKP